MHKEPFSFEAQLRGALSRVEAPAGFADSVLCRIENEQVATEGVGLGAQPGATSKPGNGLRSRHVLRFGALRFSPALAAALLLLLLPLGGYLYQRHQQAQAEAAAQQFTLAMRLTHAALLDAGQQVAEFGRDRNPE